MHTGDPHGTRNPQELYDRQGARLQFLAGLALAVVLGVSASGQELHQRRAPSVTMVPVGITTVTRGKPGNVELDFRVISGFHINSNTPRSDFLIPTVLKLDPPTDIVIGRVTYPPGEDRAFPFAPTDPLSVYSGTFPLTVVVRPLMSVIPGRYMVHGRLKYQACDNAACYPPQQLPVEFEVKVVKSKTEGYHKNPPQSPHAHR
jgi:Thiol:disulfide interchange protein DsbD, N-terminal